MRGHKLVTHHTNVCKFSQLCGAIFSFAKDESLSNLTVLLILARSFQWCRRIFPNLSMSNVEKTVEGSIPNLYLFLLFKRFVTWYSLLYHSSKKVSSISNNLLMFAATNTVRGVMENLVDEDENYYVKLEGHENHSCDLLKLQ